MARRCASHLSRSWLLLLFLCMSNVYVHGQTPSQGTNTTPTPTGTPSSVTGATTNVGTPTGTSINVGTPTNSSGGTGTPTPSLPPRTPQDPPSRLTMEEPKESSKNPPMFPIGSDIKFSWSYDNYLLLPPANITIEAYTADNRIFTIGNALPGNTVNYTWTKAAQQNDTQPLLTAMYTLRIFDGAVGRNGRLAEGGYLLTYSGLRFGMYRPEEYIPGDQQHPPVCARCSFASTSGSVEKALPAVLTLMLCLFASLMAFA